jgi:uncharacterized protein YkwD
VADLPHVRTALRHRSTGPRRWLGLLAAVCAIGLLSGTLTSCESTAAERAAVRDMVNQSRAAAGLPPLRENATLDMKADGWAQKMRNECRIWHSNLAEGAPPEWRKLGENVGMGGTIDQVHVAYMNSPGHKANVLDGSYNQIGTAAVWGNCRGYRTVFTVHVFMRA